MGNRAAGSAPGLANLSNGGSDLLHEGQVVSSRSGLANLGNGGWGLLHEGQVGNRAAGSAPDQSDLGMNWSDLYWRAVLTYSMVNVGIFLENTTLEVLLSWPFYHRELQHLGKITTGLPTGLVNYLYLKTSQLMGLYSTLVQRYKTELNTEY